MEAYQSRGRYYILSFTDSDSNLAIQDFSRAIELDPKDAMNYSWRGGTYAGLQKYDLAIQDYGKAIEIDPKQSGFYAARGRIRSWLKKPELAVADLSRGHRNGPE